MMELKVQIITLIYSFFYGVFFSFLIMLNRKYLYYSKKVFKLIFTFLFVLINTLLYFFILKIFNEGILHYYYLIVFTIGFFLEHYYFRRFYRNKKISTRLIRIIKSSKDMDTSNKGKDSKGKVV